MMIVLALDVKAAEKPKEEHVDPPGCMCLDCRARRN
jgi:hypothetical protein